MYQSHCYTHRILPPNRFERNVARMPADQTNIACRSNAVQDLGSVQLISMVNTKPKLIANSRAVKYQRIEESV